MDEKQQFGERAKTDEINGTVANDGNRSPERRRPSAKITGIEEIQLKALEDKDGSSTVVNIKETQCGLGSWRPQCLGPFGTIWSFTAAVSMLWVISGISSTYYSAVIPQIERRFGLSSSLTGFIRNIDNVGYMVVILAVSHLGRYANKPRILAASSLLSAFSILVFAAPHFIYGGGLGQYGYLPGGNSSSAGWNASRAAAGRRRWPYDVCDGVGQTVTETSDCRQQSSLLEFNEGALALFILSQLMLGMALSPTSSLTLTYMDDNVKDKSPKYFGIYTTDTLNF